MRLSSALLCDYAAVREGLLTTVSAGITRVSPPALPAPLGLFVALVIEVEPDQRALPHEIRMGVVGPDHSVVGKIRGAFQVGSGDFEADEVSLIPVPFDLRPVPLAHAGWYSIDITVDAQAPVSLRFKVLEPAGTAGQPIFIEPGRQAVLKRVPN